MRFRTIAVAENSNIFTLMKFREIKLCCYQINVSDLTSCVQGSHDFYMTINIICKPINKVGQVTHFLYLV